MFTPHKSRIDRRIRAFELEKNVHILEKDEFLRQDAKQHDLAKHKLDNNLKLEQHKVTMEAAAKAIRTTKIEETGLVAPSSIAPKL